MARAGKTKAGKRRSNPLLRGAARMGRPRISFDGQSVSCTLITDQSATGGTTVKLGYDWQEVGCSSNEGMNRSASDVTKHYQDYRYRSAMIEWFPRVGPASTEAPTRVSVSYIDNPELINQFKALTAAPSTAVTRIKQVANVRTFNAWERFTFRVPLTYRRKWFNVNTSIGSTSNNEETERCIQGLVLFGYETIGNTTAAGDLGQFRMVSSTDLRGFTAQDMP